MGEDGKGSQQGRRTRILVQERPHQQFQGRREGQSDQRSDWIGDLAQGGIQPPCPLSKGNGLWPGRLLCVRGLCHGDLCHQKEGRPRLPGEDSFICQGLNEGQTAMVTATTARDKDTFHS